MQYTALESAMQDALSRYRQPSCQVVLVPPFNALDPSADDGVRIVSGAGKAMRLHVCMRTVLERNNLPYVELQSTSRRERVLEVKQLLGI